MSCLNAKGQPKARFDTRADANRRLAELPELEGCHAYRCVRCGYFHLGHYPTDEHTRRRLRDRHRSAS